MTNQKIVSIDVRIQPTWTGKQAPYYSAQIEDGFPGVAVPLELMALLHALEGAVVSVEDGDFIPNAADSVRKLFRNLMGERGPGYCCWDLDDPTGTRPGGHWQGASEGVAFPLAKRDLDSDQRLPFTIDHEVAHDSLCKSIVYVAFFFEGAKP